ncbi:MAG: TetR/AcrR family transcriptional regulator [Pseudomonadota bacterium]
MARLRRKRRGSYHHGDLRRALLEEALRIIDEEGVPAVSTRVLARRLGVSHAAPAHHFSSREALLAEVAVQGFRTFADALEAAAASKTEPRARLAAVGRAYVHFAVRHPSYLRVMFGRGFKDGFETPEALQAESTRAYRVLTAAVASVVESQGQDAESADELAFAAWSLVHGMAMLWIDGPAQRTLGTLDSFEALADRVLGRSVLGFA